MRVLFVCLGNICRSPAAEGVLRDLAPDMQIDSAGTGGWHVGAPPYAPMQAAMNARGFDLSDLRARQFEARDFQRFDLIVAMDPDNLHAIERKRPTASITPVRLFTDFAPDCGTDTVPDPYYTRNFSETVDLIEICAAGLCRFLKRVPTSKGA